MSSDDVDVLIVGAGPAGISTWLHLHQFAPALANQSAVIDQAVFPRFKLCAGGVGGWSQSVLDRLSVELNIPSLFISDVEFHYRAQRWTYHRPNQFRMVQRSDFDTALMQAARRRGLAFREKETFLGVRRARDGLVVRTNQGQYRVKTLVGADGALSKVRRSVMGPRFAHLAPTIQVSNVISDAGDTDVDRPKMKIDFTPVDDDLQGYCWQCPCPLGETLGLNSGVVHFRFFKERPKPDMKRIFQRALRVQGIDAEHGTWCSHPISWRSTDAQRSPDGGDC